MEWNTFASSSLARSSVRRVKLPGWHFPLVFSVLGRVKRKKSFVSFHLIPAADSNLLSSDGNRNRFAVYSSTFHRQTRRKESKKSARKLKEEISNYFYGCESPTKNLSSNVPPHICRSRDCFWWRMVPLKIPWNLYISIMFLASFGRSASSSTSVFSGAARWLPTNNKTTRGKNEKQRKEKNSSKKI